MVWLTKRVRILSASTKRVSKYVSLYPPHQLSRIIRITSSDIQTSGSITTFSHLHTHPCADLIRLYRLNCLDSNGMAGEQMRTCLRGTAGVVGRPCRTDEHVETPTGHEHDIPAPAHGQTVSQLPGCPRRLSVCRESESRTIV